MRQKLDVINKKAQVSVLGALGEGAAGTPGANFISTFNASGVAASASPIFTAAPFVSRTGRVRVIPLVVSYVVTGLPVILIGVFTVLLYGGLWFAFPLIRRLRGPAGPPGRAVADPHGSAVADPPGRAVADPPGPERAPPADRSSPR